MAASAGDGLSQDVSCGSVLKDWQTSTRGHDYRQRRREILYQLAHLSTAQYRYFFFFFFQIKFRTMRFTFIFIGEYKCGKDERISEVIWKSNYYFALKCIDCGCNKMHMNILRICVDCLVTLMQSGFLVLGDLISWGTAQVAAPEPSQSRLSCPASIKRRRRRVRNGNGWLSFKLDVIVLANTYSTFWNEIQPPYL